MIFSEMDLTPMATAVVFLLEKLGALTLPAGGLWIWERFSSLS